MASNLAKSINFPNIFLSTFKMLAEGKFFIGIRSFVEKVRNHGNLRRQLIIAHDILITTASFPAAILLRENFALSDKHIPSLLFGTLLIFILSLLIFRITGLHQRMWRYTSPRDLLRVLQALLLVALAFISLMFLVDRLIGVSRSAVFIFYLIAFAGLSCSRIIYGCLAIPSGMILKRSRGKTMIRALLAGSVPSTAQLAQAIQSEYSSNIQIVGVVGRHADIGRIYQGMTVLGHVGNLKQVLAQLDVLGMRPDRIIVPETEKVADPNSYHDLRSIGDDLNLKVISSSSLGTLEHIDQSIIAGYEFIGNLIQRNGYQRVKRCIDVCIAGAALVLLCPLFLIIASVSLATNGSPVLFRQVRSGRHMQEFFLLKFRTMRDPFDSKGRLLPDQKRTSQFGRFLRVTRLDELPQLWNILIGDMALIGPRPLHIRDLSLDRDVIEKRHAILPGLTGWAQVNGGQLLSSKQKTFLDLFYINHSTFSLDCKIIILTVRMMIFGEFINYSAILEAEKSIGTAENTANLPWCENAESALPE